MWECDGCTADGKCVKRGSADDREECQLARLQYSIGCFGWERGKRSARWNGDEGVYGTKNWMNGSSS